MTARQWTVVAAAVFCLPVLLVIGVLMTLGGKDPFRALQRVTRSEG